MTNINQEIADLKAKLAELEKKVAGGAEPNGFTIGQTYFVLETDGMTNRYTYSADEIDIGFAAQGNAFHTEAEAIRERDKRALLQELKAFRKGDKFTRGIDNWAIYFEHTTSQWRLDNYSCCDVLPLTGHFSSREEAERAILHFGDRLNLLREG